jgi:hypothetical protein
VVGVIDHNNNVSRLSSSISIPRSALPVAVVVPQSDSSNRTGPALISPVQTTFGTSIPVLTCTDTSTNASVIQQMKQNPAVPAIVQRQLAVAMNGNPATQSHVASNTHNNTVATHLIRSGDFTIPVTLAQQRAASAASRRRSEDNNNSWLM